MKCLSGRPGESGESESRKVVKCLGDRPVKTRESKTIKLLDDRPKLG